MTSADDRTEFAPGVLLAAPLRAHRARALAEPGWLRWARVGRAARRQALFAALAATCVALSGALFDYLARAPYAAAIWVPAGAAIGLLGAVARELGRNTITSIASVSRHRGYRVVGASPLLTSSALRQLPPDARTPLGAMTFQPSSVFAAAFRDLQAAIAADGVVAFISAAPLEGATTTALCAAASAVQQGRRAIVLDCDIRRRTLTRALGRSPDAGIFEAASDPEIWRSVVDEEDETGLPFIPAARQANAWRSLFAAPGFSGLLDRLRAEYDLVVLDCPPALTNADGAMIARNADRSVIVTAWDETPLGAVRHTVRTLRARSRSATSLYVNRVPAGYRFGRLRPE